MRFKLPDTKPVPSKRSERSEDWRTKPPLTILKDTSIWDIDSLSFIRDDWGT